VPDVGDEVLVAFEAGEPAKPYVIGALWSSQDRLPETMDAAGANNRKALRTRSGIRIILDDAPGQERIVLETPAGQRVTLGDGPGMVEIGDASGNRIKLEPSGITINAAANVKVTAARVDLSAGLIQADSVVTRFSGVVQCDTLVTNSVISSSYTPGAGNIW